MAARKGWSSSCSVYSMSRHDMLVRNRGDNDKASTRPNRGKVTRTVKRQKGKDKTSTRPTRGKVGPEFRGGNDYLCRNIRGDADQL